MRKYEKKQEYAEREILVEIKCDLCGMIGKYGHWKSSIYETDDATILGK